MKKRFNPAVIGGFVVGAIALSIVGIILLGGGAFMQERFPAIVYFEESISGLDVGAPVDFQGVRIGTVTSVRVEMSAEDSSDTIYRPVTFQIELQRIHFQGGPSNRGQEAMNRIERLVQEQSLRAQLATQSILTGKSKIELVFAPGTPINRKNRDQGAWEMPTIPSPLIALINEIENLPLPDIVRETHRAVKHVADLLDPETIGPSLGSLNQTLTEVNEILDQVKRIMDPLATESIGAMRDIRAAVADLVAVTGRVDANLQPMIQTLTNTTRRIGYVMDPEAPMRGEVIQLINDFREASRSIRLLVEHLEQHPESILWGKETN